MATALHDVLSSMLEDARKYQALARRANGALPGSPGDEPAAGALKEIERLGRSQAREAERLLTRRTAERSAG